LPFKCNLQRYIEDSVFEWKEKGVNIVYRWRSNRHGYKVGPVQVAFSLPIA
jgi:hypothetical protein